MREVSVRELGHTQYLVSFGKFSFRTAVDNGICYIAMSDLAECCGYKAGRKLATRTNIPKVKLEARHLDGRKVGSTSPMWFLSIDDAIQFAQERAVDDGFRKWFIDYAKTLRERPIPKEKSVTSSTRPAQENPKAPAAKPTTGVNISPELIDRIIVDLLALKQVITSA